MRQRLSFVTLLMLPSLVSAVPLPSGRAELPIGLRKIPENTAILVHLRIGEVWDHPKAVGLRAALKDELKSITDEVHRTTGIQPANVDTLTLILAGQPQPDGRSRESECIVVTTREPLDRGEIARGFRFPVPDGQSIPDVIRREDYRKSVLRFLSPNAFSLMEGSLDADYQAAKPYRADGREPEAIRVAGTSENLATIWFNPPVIRGMMGEELQRDPQLQTFLPILNSRSAFITFTIDDDVIRAAGRLIAEDGQGEKVEPAVGQLIRQFVESAGNERARLQQRGADKYAMELFLFDQLIDHLKDVKPERQGGAITAHTELKVTDEMVKELKDSFAKQVLAKLPTARANQLKQLGLAMHNYHDSYNGFPAAAITDKNGKPLLSWRVAILPFIEQEALYKEFKLDEPWDSEHNKKLIAKMPPLYLVPGVNKNGDTATHYRVFIDDPKNPGPVKPAFGLTEKKRLNGITDGTSNTAMVLEAAEAVPWTKPEGLEYDANKPVPKLHYDEHGRCGVVFCDGSVRVFRKDIPEATLRAVITSNGGEVVMIPE